VLRVDRVRGVEVLDSTSGAPEDLDALAEVEDQFSQGWRYQVEVEIAGARDECRAWLPRTFGRLEQLADGRTLLRATTDEPEWYAATLANLPMPFRVVGGSELRAATAELARRLAAAAGA
jgi:predicted DNA-binding transcriptional regulator YafY